MWAQLMETADVQSAHSKIKQNLLSGRANLAMDLDLPRATKSRIDGLVLPDDPTFDVILLFPPSKDVFS